MDIVWHRFVFAFVFQFLIVFSRVLPTFQSSNQFLSSRQVFPLRSYRDAQIFRYEIPTDVSTALWRFNATVNDASYFKNTLSHYHSIVKKSCEPLDITVYLRWGSIPTIDINNSSIPENFLFDNSQQYKIELKSDSSLVKFNISNPYSGYWFGLAFINQVDDRISQKGLTTECVHKLASSLSFAKVSDVTILTPLFSLIQNITKSSNYKFYTGSNWLSAKLIVQQCASLPVQSVSQCPIAIYTRSMAFPDANKHEIAVNCSNGYNEYNECRVSNIEIPGESWVYILIEPFGIPLNSMVDAIEYKLQLVIEDVNSCQHLKDHSISGFNSQNVANLSPSHDYKMLNNESNQFDDIRCPNFISLTRYDRVGTFDFKYSHVDAVNFSETRDIFPLFDIANNRLSILEFDISQPDFGGSLVIEFSISPLTNTSEQNVSVSLCLQFGELPLSRQCLAQINSNTSGVDFVEGNSVKSIVIPYPRSGKWYIGLNATCYHIDFEHSEEEVVAIECNSNVTSVLLDIVNSPCMRGKCNDRGKCLQYLSGGVLFSSCLCRAGWKGWICNDGSQAIPDDQLLLNFLLLTLSNIIFIPAVILATYKKHFTEAIVYLTTMASSTLYHACDSDYTQSYCILSLNVLQFGDFYSALLAFWVTLITLSNMPDSMRTFFHMVGAIVIAYTVEIDRTSLWAFALPSGVGGFILLVSWSCHCCCKKSCFPSGRLYLLSILPGVALTSGGLVIYANFETQDNYAITHSCWHAIMALAVLFLVPAMRRRDSNDDSGEGVIKHQNAKLAHVEWRPSQTFKFLADDIDML